MTAPSVRMIAAQAAEPGEQLPMVLLTEAEP